MCSMLQKVDFKGKEKILDHFEKTVEDLVEDVQFIKEWASTQPHLPEIPSTNLIQCFLTINKFSFENTKKKIDMYYTVRSMFPDIFKDSNPKLPRMENGLTAQYTIPLPKLIDGVHRVFFIKPKKLNSVFDPYVQLGILLNLYEIRLQEDFIFSDILVVDGSEISVNHVVHSTPMHIKAAVTIFEQVYSNRVKEVHVFNHPAVFDKLFNLVKLFLKPKLQKRIHFHDSVKSLSEYIPLEVLPKDYGGEEQCLDSLEKMCKRKLMEYEDRFDTLDTLRVNESLRPTPMKDMEKFGVEGTFRKLNVD